MARRPLKKIDWVAITRGMRMNLPTHLSYSSIELFRRCPAAWKARYIDQIKESVGSAAQFGTQFGLHVTAAMGLPVVDRFGQPAQLEQLEGMDGAVAAYKAHDANWITDAKERNTRAEVEIRIGQDEWAEIQSRYGVEQELAMPILGYCDYTRKMPDGVRTELLDLKTSSRLEFQPSWNLQVLLYASDPKIDASAVSIHLIAKRSRNYGVGVHTILLDHNKALMKEALETVAYYTRIIKATLDDAQFLTLPRTPSWGCAYCPVANDCVTSRHIK